ncbi:MAG: hypothetical protein U9N53_04650 [Bacteroidota bacterium]|nr:hypothetical protein [Bacteroidota bacterium]
MERCAEGTPLAEYWNIGRKKIEVTDALMEDECTNALKVITEVLLSIVLIHNRLPHRLKPVRNRPNIKFNLNQGVKPNQQRKEQLGEGERKTFIDRLFF